MKTPAVFISRHAWRRFITRYGQPLPKCPMNELRRLIDAAEPENLGGGNVIRLIKNNYVPAAYYTVDGWRFVFDETSTRLLTVERVLVKTKNRGRPNRWRKY